MANVSEASYEHDDPVSTDEPAIAAEALATPAAAVTPAAEPAAAAAPEPVGSLPKAFNPRRSAAPTRRAPGLTDRGVCVLIALATFLGGMIDMATSGHRGHLFGVLFVIASALGALAVRKKDLRVAMIAPPLLYCALIFVMSLIDQAGLTGGRLTREAFYLGNAFVTGAPAIWSGSLLAAAIGWYRLRASDRR